ncbi:MAG TPA: hypothetical protein VFC80_01395 [Sphaerochaeta sp.]|nr:hypothetical protein [Sphaerochaeta sp.]
MFCGFFQFPSALTGCKASDGTVEYSPDPSGHIDILVRKGRGINTKLTVIELKRKYDKLEQTIKQAIVYAVFMQRLLRCADADNIKWWKFLGFYRKKNEDEIKDRLEKRTIRIQAVIAMPTSKQNKTDFIDELDIPYGQGKNDKLILHYLYFNHDEDGTITDIVETSLK